MNLPKYALWRICAARSIFVGNHLMRGHSTKPETHLSPIPAYGDIPWKKPAGFNTGIQIHNPLTNGREDIILPWSETLRWYILCYSLYSFLRTLF